MGSDPYKLFTAGEVAVLCGGRLLGKKGGNAEINSVVIDSRVAGRGALFVPLKGEKTDGHQYIHDVLQAGAACILVASSWEAQVRALPGTEGTDLVIVKDPLKCLQTLAQFWISKFPDLIRIGVTGSSGKTTTKELLYSILSVASRVKANKGNLNSEIGLPLSLFSLRKDDVYGIFEMGINFKGEMDILAQTFKPQYVVVTNIGTAHIGPLGGEEGIVKEKVKAFAYFSKNSRAFIPEEGAFSDILKNESGGRFVLFGKGVQTGINNLVMRGIDGWTFSYKGLPVIYALPGVHNLSNMFAAIAVAEYFQVPPVEIKKGLEAVSPLSGRSRIRKGAVTVIEDSYNANVESAQRVLEFLTALPMKNGRKVVVFGSMKELGSETERLHRVVGEKILTSDIDAVFLYGKETRVIDSFLKSRNFKKPCFYTETFEVLKDHITDFVVSGDIVLLKGSRSMELEHLLEVLQPKEVPAHV